MQSKYTPPIRGNRDYVMIKCVTSHTNQSKNRDYIMVVLHGYRFIHEIMEFARIPTHEKADLVCFQYLYCPTRYIHTASAHTKS